MKICLICVEIFAWGKYGGYGRSTRMIGRELADRGYEVSAIIPRREDQKPVENLDGIEVFGFDRWNPLSSLDLYRQVDADIYHSQEPSFGTYLAQVAMPDRKHVVTFRDTRDWLDWWIEYRFPSKSKMQVMSNLLYEDNFLVRKAVQRADGLFATAELLIPKATEKYHLSKKVSFLPSPVPFPESVRKSETPVVCFVGRLDQRKRPQIFLELAAQFPEVNFVLVGKGQNKKWESKLISDYNNLPNLEVIGFIDQFDLNNHLSNLLGKSWILVNTSAREGLPTSFIEAANHRCAILSALDPDKFASRFGYFVKNDNFAQGLRYLLQYDRWKDKGEKAYRYISELYSVENSITKHIEEYKKLMLNENI